MARMYSRKRGKSGSKRPLKRDSPEWSHMKDKEVEMLIVKLAKEGKSPSEIGMVLRDSYGIPDVKAALGKRLTAVLKEKDVAPKMPEDLLALMRRAASIRKHLDNNRQDMPAKRGKQLTDSKINRLVKHYKANGKLPIDFRYNPDQLSLYIE